MSFFHQMFEIDQVDTDSMTKMRLMMNMLTTEEKQIELYGRKINLLPNFIGELRNEGGRFPKGVDSEWANSYLQSAFEQLYHEPHFHELYLKSPDFEPNE